MRVSHTHETFVTKHHFISFIIRSLDPYKARGQLDIELVYSHYICSNKINIIVNISSKTVVVQCTCHFFFYNHETPIHTRYKLSITGFIIYLYYRSE